MSRLIGYPRQQLSGGTMDQDQVTSILADTLRAMAGPEATPRDGQVAAVTSLVIDRERLLVVQATGWGKSLVYWAASRYNRSQGAGPTVVISPLLALMRDQINAATRVGLRAATVNSANSRDWQRVFDALARDEIDVLLVSPERLANPAFADQALPLLSRAGLLVIDEAHCISDWGFDFRPDYQRVTRLLLQLRPDTPVLATTATANARVTGDVARQLGPDTRVIRGPLTRSSLALSVVPDLSAIERFAWVADALQAMSGSGIVYCLTVDQAEALAEFLAAQGYPVAAYTGRTDPELRAEIEEDLRHNRIKAVVATSALGMGYDKPDLAFCIHVGSPDSPVSYYQQVGRAGRQLSQATAVLLPAGESDERIWRYFATATLPDPDLATAVLDLLGVRAMSVLELESETGGRRGRLESLLKQLRVDGAVDRRGSAWVATGAPWHYDQAKYDDILSSRRAEAQLMREYAAGNRCLMQLLVTALDDPHSRRCGRCSVCTGTLPPPGRRPSPERVRAASVALRGRYTDIPPRLRWPRSVSRRGTIVGAEQGRAVAFADDPGRPELVREVAASDAPPSPELALAVAETWRGWQPGTASAVVALPDPEHPRRALELASAVAAQLQLPLLDCLSWEGAPTPSAAASASAVNQIESQLRLDRSAVPAGPLLLVCERARSRWTLTVAAVLLREAGATAIWPLVAHLRA